VLPRCHARRTPGEHEVPGTTFSASPRMTNARRLRQQDDHGRAHPAFSVCLTPKQGTADTEHESNGMKYLHHRTWDARSRPCRRAAPSRSRHDRAITAKRTSRERVGRVHLPGRSAETRMNRHARSEDMPALGGCAGGAWRPRRARGAQDSLHDHHQFLERERGVPAQLASRQVPVRRARSKGQPTLALRRLPAERPV